MNDQTTAAYDASGTASPPDPDGDEQRGGLLDRLRAHVPPVPLVVEGGGYVLDETPTVKRAQVWYMARGADVDALHDYLTRLGIYDPDDEDADDEHVFGAATEAALRAFQTRTGLASTGVADEPTWQALAHAAGPRL